MTGNIAVIMKIDYATALQWQALNQIQADIADTNHRHWAWISWLGLSYLGWSDVAILQITLKLGSIQWAWFQIQNKFVESESARELPKFWPKYADFCSAADQKHRLPDSKRRLSHNHFKAWHRYEGDRTYQELLELCDARRVDRWSCFRGSVAGVDLYGLDSKIKTKKWFQIERCYTSPETYPQFPFLGIENPQ